MLLCCFGDLTVVAAERLQVQSSVGSKRLLLRGCTDSHCPCA